LAGLLLALAGPVSHFLLLAHPWQRATALPAFVLLAAGAAMALLAARRDRRRRVRAAMAGTVLLALLFSLCFFVLFRLPESEPARALDSAPDFTLPDHLGTPVSLAAERTRGPVLLVFYRGHW